MNKIDRLEVLLSSSEYTVQAVEVFVKEFQAKGFWVSLARTFVREGEKFWVVEVQW
ncbi:MAG: hypothetical protein HY226_05975 [Candidatus Vogelbacteria bacterium]|nr:hypothetical protein [Candidatus Vogelbacteria bacterium]